MKQNGTEQSRRGRDYTEKALLGVTSSHRVVSYLEELMTNLRRIGIAEAASV